MLAMMAKELNAMLKTKEGQLGNCEFEIFSYYLVFSLTLFYDFASSELSAQRFEGGE